MIFSAMPISTPSNVNAENTRWKMIRLMSQIVLRTPSCSAMTGQEMLRELSGDTVSPVEMEGRSESFVHPPALYRVCKPI